MIELKEQIFQAIDTIISARLSKLEYNQTILATLYQIEDNHLYKIKYQGITMPAISSCTLNADDIGEKVYVLIPNGDYTNDKIILAVKRT